MIRLLRKLLDDAALAVLDDILLHLGVVWDAFGFFSPVLALLALGVAISVGLHFQGSLLLRRLPKMQELAAVDEIASPVLEVASRPGGLLPLRKRRHLTRVRLDHKGMAVTRQTGTAEVTWDQVIRWSRSGVAAWTFTLAEGTYSVEFSDKDRLTRTDLHRIDHRIALHTTRVPRVTARDKLADAMKASREWMQRRRSALAGFTRSRRRFQLPALAVKAIVSLYPIVAWTRSWTGRHRTRHVTSERGARVLEPSMSSSPPESVEDPAEPGRIQA